VSSYYPLEKRQSWNGAKKRISCPSQNRTGVTQIVIHFVDLSRLSERFMPYKTVIWIGVLQAVLALLPSPGAGRRSLQTRLPHRNSYKQWVPDPSCPTVVRWCAEAVHDTFPTTPGCKLASGRSKISTDDLTNTVPPATQIHLIWRLPISVTTCCILISSLLLLRRISTTTLSYLEQRIHYDKVRCVCVEPG
jgi:hypothetical protein